MSLIANTKTLFQSMDDDDICSLSDEGRSSGKAGKKKVSIKVYKKNEEYSHKKDK